MGRFLPRQDVPIAEQGGRTSTPFYVFLQELERALSDGTVSTEGLQEQIAAIAMALGSPDGTVANIPPRDTDVGLVLGTGSIRQMGLLSDGKVFLSLMNDADAPGNTYVYGTTAEGVKGWQPVSDALAQGEGLVLTVGADGVTTFDLAELPDSGTGELLAFTKDAYGRVSGTREATTDDLAEGANLYFTAERAIAAVGSVSGGEILVQNGSSAPPVMLTNEAEDDFIYSD